MKPLKILGVIVDNIADLSVIMFFPPKIFGFTVLEFDSRNEYEALAVVDTDDITTMVACRLDKKVGAYMPHSKDWVKEKIYILLRKQAGQ